MSKLFSNPWKDRSKLSSRIKYRIRKLFYKWLLKKYCKSCKTALDVGCGNNNLFIETAKAMGIIAKGIDLDERFKSEDVEIGSIFDVQKKHDIVFNNNMIEGFTSEQQQKFTKKLAEISNDIIITIGSYNSVKFYNTPDFVTPVTKIRLRWLFRRYGFRNLLSIHIPFWKAVVVISKRVTNKDTDLEAKKIREGFW